MTNPSRAIGRARATDATDATVELRVSFDTVALGSTDTLTFDNRTRCPQYRRVAAAASLVAAIVIAASCGTSDRERAQELCASVVVGETESRGGEPMSVAEVVAELEARDAAQAEYWRGLDADLFVARCESIDAAGRVGEFAINERGDNVLLAEPALVPTSAPGDGY